jgi:hypothetical protein
MNIKLFNVALGLALTATTISASAQKTYTEGVVTVNTLAMGQPVVAKDYFRADSNALIFTNGPATIKILSDAKNTFFAILLDVPVVSMKKAAILTPDEIEQQLSTYPKFTFSPTTETKQISGFNCKKVIATDTKTQKAYDVWITNDISIPETGFRNYYTGIGGFPVQYTSFAQGQESSVTVTGITDTKAPAGTFGIAADFDKISLDDLKAMGPK